MNKQMELFEVQKEHLRKEMELFEAKRKVAESKASKFFHTDGNYSNFIEEEHPDV